MIQAVQYKGLTAKHCHPDYGNHPVRIAEVVKTIREASLQISHCTQLIYTHNPLVLNECQPAEVSLVTRNRAGQVVVTRFDRTKSFAQRSGAFALGELWLTFCDGDKEAQLVPE